MNKREKNNSENAKLALKYRLYSHPHWELKAELEEIVATGKSTCTLHVKDGVPIACAIREYTSKLIMVFVRKSYRKQGIGSRLVKRLKVDGCWGVVNSPSKGRIFEYNGISVG